MRTIIIDDMSLARATLKADLETYCPELDIVAEASGVVEGAKMLRSVPIDLIFLDIHMDDGEGFDILDILPDLTASVIFTTASSDHAVKAFQYAAIDYLLKPIDPELLMIAVERAKNQPGFGLAQKDALQSKEKSKLVLNVQEELKVVEIKNIIRCQSLGNYTQFFFSDGSKLLVTKTLKEYDSVLKDRNFLRVHQSHLVNLDFVETFKKSDGGYLVMKDGASVSVSVRKKPLVMDTLKAMQ